MSLVFCCLDRCRACAGCVSLVWYRLCLASRAVLCCVVLCFAVFRCAVLCCTSMCHAVCVALARCVIGELVVSCLSCPRMSPLGLLCALLAVGAAALRCSPLAAKQIRQAEVPIA